MENKRGIFFSSDLIFGMGEANGEIIDGNWQEEVVGADSKHRTKSKGSADFI